MRSRNLITIAAVLFAALTPFEPTRAQSIDYGMLTPGGIESPAGTPLLIGGGFRLMGVTPGSGFNPSGASLAELKNTGNMLSVSNSFATMDVANPGVFYQAGLLPIFSIGAAIPTGTQLYVLASTSSSFDDNAPWALVTGSDVGWFSPNPTDPFAYSNIELLQLGNSVVAAGFGGPGVGAYFVPPGVGTTVPPIGDPSSDVKLILVPEPSTCTLLAMSAAGALWWARRRR